MTNEQISAAKAKLDLRLHFESIFNQIVENKAQSPMKDIIWEISKATATWVEGFDALIASQPVVKGN